VCVRSRLTVTTAALLLHPLSIGLALAQSMRTIIGLPRTVPLYRYHPRRGTLDDKYESQYRSHAIAALSWQVGTELFHRGNPSLHGWLYWCFGWCCRCKGKAVFERALETAKAGETECVHRFMKNPQTRSFGQGVCDAEYENNQASTLPLLSLPARSISCTGCRIPRASKDTQGRNGCTCRIKSIGVVAILLLLLQPRTSSWQSSRCFRGTACVHPSMKVLASETSSPNVCDTKDGLGDKSTCSCLC